MKLRRIAAVLAVTAATAGVSATAAPAAEAYTMIKAPSFSHLCDGAGHGAYLLFKDGRVYDCGNQSFLLP